MYIRIFAWREAIALEGEIEGGSRGPDGIIREVGRLYAMREDVDLVKETAAEESLERLGAAFYEEAPRLKFVIEHG